MLRGVCCVLHLMVRSWSDTMAHGIDYIATRPVIAKNFGNVEGKVADSVFLIMNNLIGVEAKVCRPASIMTIYYSYI